MNQFWISPGCSYVEGGVGSDQSIIKAVLVLLCAIVVACVDLIPCFQSLPGIFIAGYQGYLDSWCYYFFLPWNEKYSALTIWDWLSVCISFLMVGSKSVRSWYPVMISFITLSYVVWCVRIIIFLNCGCTGNIQDLVAIHAHGRLSEPICGYSVITHGWALGSRLPPVFRGHCNGVDPDGILSENLASYLWSLFVKLFVIWTVGDPSNEMCRKSQKIPFTIVA